MFDVVTCGLGPARLAAHPEHLTIRELPSPSSDGFLESALEMFADQDVARRVLLVHAERREDTRRLAMLRSMLRSAGLVPVPLLLPTVGVASAATWLASLAAHGISAGTVLANLGVLERHVRTYAVTGSVAGLALPEVRLRHHVLSWLPGTKFSVAIDGSRRVVAGDLRAAEPPTAGASDIVWAGERSLAPRVSASRPGQVGETISVPVPDDAPNWWGRSRFYEHCVVPASVDSFAQEISGRPLAACPQCGDAMRRYCPFCLAQEVVPG